MKTLLSISLGCALFLPAISPAADGARKERRGEAEKARKELLEKYDANKNGKLEKSELAQMTPEERQKARKLFHHGKKQEAEKPAPAADKAKGETTTDSAPAQK